MDNLEEMDEFLGMYKFPKLNQEEIKNTNRPIITSEIQSVIIIILSTNKSLGSDDLTGEFYQTF